MKGFFLAAVACVHFVQTECLEFAVEIPVATDGLCHAVVRSYPAVLKLILDTNEVLEGYPALLRGLPTFLPHPNGISDDYSLTACFVMSSFFTI